MKLLHGGHYNSRTVTDWRCGRERFLTFDQGGASPELMTPPDHIPSDVFVRQRAHRENEVKLAMDLMGQFKDDLESVGNIIDTAFPQNFDACISESYLCNHYYTCHPEQADTVRV